MSGKLLFAMSATLVLASAGVCAAEARVDVSDRNGRPLAGAVVELAATGQTPEQPASVLPGEAIVDQRHETFIPLVTLIRKGGHVVFTNNDSTMHQVYSFSSIKQFAFEIDEGQHSEPVVFDKPGVAAIGCNIHDRMITYVYVSAGPWAAVSDSSGRAIIGNLPPGSYRGRVWHPELAPGTSLPSFSIAVTDSGGNVAATLPVSGSAALGKKPMHMQMY